MIAKAFGLVMVMVSTETSPVPMDEGEKPLETVAALATTSVSLAAARLAPASVVVSVPIGNALV